jgi:hypothetical protein
MFRFGSPCATLLGGGLSLAAATTLALAVTSGPGSAVSSAPHTMTFTSTSKSEVDPTATTFVSHNVDKLNGKVIGYDLSSGNVDPDTGALTFHVAFGFKGGLVFADLKVVGGGTVSGPITGGSGKFAGVTGTITSEPPQGNSSRVTLRYQR